MALLMAVLIIPECHLHNCNWESHSHNSANPLSFKGNKHGSLFLSTCSSVVKFLCLHLELLKPRSLAAQLMLEAIFDKILVINHLTLIYLWSGHPPGQAFLRHGRRDERRRQGSSRSGPRQAGRHLRRQELGIDGLVHHQPRVENPNRALLGLVLADDARRSARNFAFHSSAAVEADATAGCPAAAAGSSGRTACRGSSVNPPHKPCYRRAPLLT